MDWLLSPLAWLLLAGVLAAWAAYLRRLRRWLFAASGLLAAVAMAGMTPLAANALGGLLAQSVSAPAACNEAPPAIAVVLAGGMDGRPRDRNDATVLNQASRRRVEHAVDWWREAKGRSLVMVGGPRRSIASVAELMAAYAGSLGVPSAALRVETDSDTTWGNALHAAAMVPRLPRRIGLVTSLIHMPRAQVAFASAGFKTCPLGAEFRRLPSRLPWALVPRTVGLANTELALHEWVGLLYYRWLAR